MVDYAEQMCVVQRSFGTGDDLRVLGFRPIPLADKVELILMRPERSGGFRRGKGVITLSPSQKSVTSDFNSYHLDKPGLRVVTFYADLSIDAMVGAASLTVTGDKDGPVSFAARGSPDLLRTVSACEDNLLDHWGIDAKTVHAWSRPPAPVGGDEGSWFRSNDYPVEALRANTQGRAIAVGDVGADGKVGACRIVVTAKSAALDNRTCSVLLHRGRYVPALDANGRPTPSWTVLSVHWLLP